MSILNDENDCLMQKNVVSIIIATYKRENTLDRAIKSVVSQTYPYIEIIVVDDNANAEWNKKVEAIVEKYRLAHKEIIYIQNKENMGSARTRNMGIKNASGEYITFLDDDDIYLPEKVENQLKKMTEVLADYGITDLELYNQKNALVEKRKRTGVEKLSTKEELLVYHLKYHLTGTDTLMFKKDYLLQIGCFPQIDVGDEFYLMEKAIMGQGKFCYNNNCFVKAYIHEGDEEGLSSGTGKIEGENNLYKIKQQYFSQINKHDRKYIIMRHYAVLAFAFLRKKQYVFFLSNALKSFVCSPKECVKLLKDRI